MLRIIIKPLGAVALLAALASLTVLSFRRGQERSGVPLPANGAAAVGTSARASSTSAVPPAVPSTDPPQLLRPDGFILSGDAAQAVARLNHGEDGAYQIAIASKPKDTWGVLLIQSVSVPVPSGAKLTLRFRARCTDSASNTIRIAYEEDAPPYPKQLEKEISLAPRWQQFTFPITTTRSFGTNQSKVGFHLGYHAGHIEIADIQLGPSPGK